MKRFIILAAAALMLSACVSAGIATQAQSEQAYSVAAIAANVYLETGKPDAKAVTATCNGDNAAYGILTATRTPIDGASYSASDTAHATLQATCNKLQS